MRLCDALDDKKFDIRIRDRLIAEGKITKKDIDSYLDKIADEAGNLITTNPLKPKSKNTEAASDASAN